MAGGSLLCRARIEVDLRRPEIAAAGGEQLADEPVVGHVLLERGPNPAVVRLGGIGPEVDREFGLDPQQVGPLHRPVVGKLRTLQQAIDQHRALVGGLVVQKTLRLVRRGQRADRVEIDPPYESSIGTQLGRLDFQLFQLVEHELVDLALGRESRLDFEGIGLLQRIHERSHGGQAGIEFPRGWLRGGLRRFLEQHDGELPLVAQRPRPGRQHPDDHRVRARLVRVGRRPAEIPRGFIDRRTGRGVAQAVRHGCTLRSLTTNRNRHPQHVALPDHRVRDRQDGQRARIIRQHPQSDPYQGHDDPQDRADRHPNDPSRFLPLLLVLFGVSRSRRADVELKAVVFFCLVRIRNHSHFALRSGGSFNAKPSAVSRSKGCRRGS